MSDPTDKEIQEILGKPIPMCSFVDATRFISYTAQRAQQKEALRKLLTYDGDALEAIQKLFYEGQSWLIFKKIVDGDKATYERAREALVESKVRVAAIEAAGKLLADMLSKSEHEKDTLITRLDRMADGLIADGFLVAGNKIKAVINDV